MEEINIITTSYMKQQTMTLLLHIYCTDICLVMNSKKWIYGAKEGYIVMLLMNCCKNPLHIIISHQCSCNLFVYRFSRLFWAYKTRILVVAVYRVWLFVKADAYTSGIIQIYNAIAIFNSQRNRYYSEVDSISEVPLSPFL